MARVDSAAAEEVQAMTIRLPRELHRWLRHDAIESGKSANAIIVEALIRLREAG